MTAARRLLATVSVLLVAACLRPAITSVGPLISEIASTTDLGSLGLGLLSAVPLLMFGCVSMAAGGVARRFGLELAIAGSLALLVVGVILRSASVFGGLWIGTVLAGAAIALANVLTPAVVKRDAARPAVAMAFFTTALTTFAALASGTAVPMAEQLGGWRQALAVWALLPAAALVLWMVRMRLCSPGPSTGSSADADQVRQMMRSPAAWHVTIFFGMQSASFYTIVTWLPSIERANGVDGTTAGLHLLVYQIVGSACGMAVGFLMESRADQRLAAVSISMPVAVGCVGLALAPQLVWLWVSLAAVGAGGALTVALSLIVLRTGSSDQTASLSGMAQSFGYVIAAAGPLGAGVLAHVSGWTAVLLAIAGIAVGQTILSFWAGQASPVVAPRPGEGIEAIHLP